MGRLRGQLELGVATVFFLNELIYESKDDSFRSRVNLLSTFRNVDLKLRFNCMQEAFCKFSKHIDFIRNFSGFASLKGIILPLAAEIYNDNTFPNLLKETYFSATHYLRGVHRVQLLTDNHLITISFKGVDIVEVLPGRDEISNFRPTPVTTTTTSKPMRPLMESNEPKFAITGLPGVGKSTTVIQYISVLPPILKISIRTSLLSSCVLSFFLPIPAYICARLYTR